MEATYLCIATKMHFDLSSLCHDGGWRPASSPMLRMQVVENSNGVLTRMKSDISSETSIIIAKSVARMYAIACGYHCCSSSRSALRTMSSYQLNISPFHTFLDIPPPQDPDVSAIQVHCS